MFADFLIGIAQLLEGKDRVKLLRLAFRLPNDGSVDSARALFELIPYLNVDEKKAYCTEVTKTSDSASPSNLVALLGCYDYLPRDETTIRIRTQVDVWREGFSSVDRDASQFVKGFLLYGLQQGLAALFDLERDSISAIANLAQQEELLNRALSLYEGSRIWSARVRLARAWLLYYRAQRTSSERWLQLLDESREEATASMKALRDVADHAFIYSGLRLLYWIDHWRLLSLEPKEQSKTNLIREMRRIAEQAVRIAGTSLVDPAKLAAAYNNLGGAIRYQAQFERNPMRRRKLLVTARDIHSKGVSAVRGINDDLLPPHLHNAACSLIILSRTEMDVGKISEMLEKALKEMDEVINLPSSAAYPETRASAISLKVSCMDELSAINPITVTDKVLAELDDLSKELDGLETKAKDKHPLIYSYYNVASHCLLLARAGGTSQKQLVERAEINARKAYKIALETESYGMIGLILWNIASILMAKGILNHDPSTLDQAISTVEKSCGVLAGTSGLALPESQSLAAEIHIVKYGYTGEEEELKAAIAISRNSISYLVTQKRFQRAAEESFKLATIHMLTDDNKKAESALTEAAILFRRAGKKEPRFKNLYGNFSVTCKAVKRLVQAQTAYRSGRQLAAKLLAEHAEREMIKANARWREVWLVRGFKELVAGNFEEAKRNLTRVIKGSLGSLDDQNPTTTGYTAKKLVDFIEQDTDKKKFPPTIIDLPLRADVVFTAFKLSRISQQLSSVPSLATYSEQEELGIEEIRELISRLVQTEGKEESAGNSVSAQSNKRERKNRLHPEAEKTSRGSNP
ncbi:MAG: hypothetical protein WED04_12450 [Promethearchaeati archaeon SRVP18_Atabeyarchaeia-1]